jgi:YfiH family protein
MALPPVPDTFRWTQEAWGPALRCTPLEAVAPHLFTTRELALTDPRDLDRLAVSVGAHRVAMATQVHRADVVVIRRDRASEPSHRGEDRPDADVLVSDDPDVAVAVRAADCVPILIADPATGAVAAVHAGWRGTAAHAAKSALDALAREFGSQPRDLVAAIGPSIGACCYEVGAELVDAFAAAGHQRYLIDRWFIAPPPRKGSFVGQKMARGASSLHLDVAGANRDQLVLAGMAEANVHVSGLCTAEHLDIFPSFRAERSQAGRMAGVIVTSRYPSL